MPMASNPEYRMGTLDSFVGKELGVSDWLKIDQGRIDDFADVTEDKQWIHLDVPQAREGPFGAPIAHGLLLLGLTVKWAEESGALPADRSMCVNYGYDNIRFPSPVKAGQRVRLRSSLKKVEPRGDKRVLITTHYVIEIEGAEKPALVADCVGLFYQ
jgi:acyl dehydratase